MKNKPFSIVVVLASVVACVLMLVFLLAFDGFSERAGTFFLFLGGACLPPVILAATAGGIPLSRLANWLFSASSILVIGLAVLSVGSCVFSGSDMAGMSLMLVLIFQFVAILVPLCLILVAQLIAYVQRKTTRDAS